MGFRFAASNFIMDFMAGRLGLLLAPGSTKAQKHPARVRGPWLGGLAHCNWAVLQRLSGPVRVLTSVPTAATKFQHLKTEGREREGRIASVRCGQGYGSEELGCAMLANKGKNGTRSVAGSGVLYSARAYSYRQTPEE